MTVFLDLNCNGNHVGLDLRMMVDMPKLVLKLEKKSPGNDPRDFNFYVDPTGFEPVTPTMST